MAYLLCAGTGASVVAAEGWKPAGSVRQTQYVEEIYESGPGFPELPPEVTYEAEGGPNHQWASHPHIETTVVAPGSEATRYPQTHQTIYPPDGAISPDQIYAAESDGFLSNRRHHAAERRTMRRIRRMQRRTAGPRDDGADPFLNTYADDAYGNEAYYPSRYGDGDYCEDCDTEFAEGWAWQLLPGTLLYKSYLAGQRETRIGGSLVHDNGSGLWLLDAALGGRVGLLRYGSIDELPGEGWQLDVEAGAFPRFNADHHLDMQAVDVKFALPITWAKGPYQAKFGYSHISSHLGAEYLWLNPGVQPTDYVKNSMIFGFGYYFTDHFRMYGEAGYAFSRSGGAEEWEFQFGWDYMPIELGPGGAPFFAWNTFFREENDFSGALNIIGGWAWHGTRTDHILRLGVQFYNGKSSQLTFFRTSDQLFGIGAWYDY